MKISALYALASCLVAANAIQIWKHPSVEDAAVNARTLIKRESLTNINTIYQDGSEKGLPASFVEYYADCGDGNPVILAINMATSFKNIEEGSPYSLTVRVGDHSPHEHVNPKYPGSRPYSVAGSPRMNLRGKLEDVKEEDVEELQKCFLARHKDAVWWLPGNPIHESHFVKFIVDEAYFLGGFGDTGFIGKIPSELYHKASTIEDDHEEGKHFMKKTKGEHHRGYDIYNYQHNIRKSIDKLYKKIDSEIGSLKSLLNDEAENVEKFNHESTKEFIEIANKKLGKREEQTSLQLDGDLSTDQITSLIEELEKLRFEIQQYGKTLLSKFTSDENQEEPKDGEKEHRKGPEGKHHRGPKGPEAKHERPEGKHHRGPKGPEAKHERPEGKHHRGPKGHEDDYERSEGKHHRGPEGPEDDYERSEGKHHRGPEGPEDEYERPEGKHHRGPKGYEDEYERPEGKHHRGPEGPEDEYERPEGRHHRGPEGPEGPEDEYERPEGKHHRGPEGPEDDYERSEGKHHRGPEGPEDEYERPEGKHHRGPKGHEDEYERPEGKHHRGPEGPEDEYERPEGRHHRGPEGPEDEYERPEGKHHRGPEGPEDDYGRSEGKHHRGPEGPEDEYERPEGKHHRGPKGHEEPSNPQSIDDRKPSKPCHKGSKSTKGKHHGPEPHHGGDDEERPHHPKGHPGHPEPSFLSDLFHAFDFLRGPRSEPVIVRDDFKQRRPKNVKFESDLKHDFESIGAEAN